MIDWSATNANFGWSCSADLSTKRPKVWCRCDGCNKARLITIRVKSKIINEQLAWLCPSCVCLGRSSVISEQMKKCWSDDQYRLNQLDHKTDSDYKHLQAQKSRERWEDDAYRSQLETGIDAETYLARCNDKFPAQFSYDQSSLTNWKSKIIIKCLTCTTTFKRHPLHHLQAGSCPACKLPGTLRDILPVGYDLNDRTTLAPLELDVHWHDLKIAIEYHGLYWHSYNTQESAEQRLRHQTKALRCIDKGIRLYQFFDFEWKTNRQIVSSMINHLFNRSQRYAARNLDLIALDTATACQFFTENHLQGYRCASTTIGLVSNDIILMAASFARYKDGYEIIRMATKAGNSVAGGASRILKHFRKSTHKPIYTFANLRYSTGTVYDALGFKHLAVTKPNYFYYRGNTILSRQQCQKHKLPRLLDVFDEKMSEPENMFVNSYRRVWDAGHIKLVLN